MRLAFANDHAGYPLRQRLLELLDELGHEVEDLGTHTEEPVDFPDLAWALGEAVTSGRCERGLMVCGTGIGAGIALNKVPGVRAALAHDAHSAHQSVEHDDANVLCIGAGIVGAWLAEDLVKGYLDARFHNRPPFTTRLEKLVDLERRAAEEIRKER